MLDDKNNNQKGKIGDKKDILSSPFPKSHHVGDNLLFDRDQLNLKLKKLLPLKYHKYIKYIVADSEIFKDLRYEKAVIYYNNCDKRMQFNGDADKVNVGDEIIEFGEDVGYDLIIHNHPNGIPIASEIDIFTFTHSKTIVGIIFTPISHGIFINQDPQMNQSFSEEIHSKYAELFDELFNKILQKLVEEDENVFIEKNRLISIDKMKKLVINYFFHHPDEIIEEVNKFFEENEYKLKICKL
jgi:hypothetical protein